MSQCSILGERAPRQRSSVPQSRDTTRNDDVHFAQSVVAVAIVGGRNSIGNQRDAVWTSTTDSQLEHRWCHMLKISDQLDRHTLVEQERCHGTRLPVMQRWHGIEEMRRDTRAGIDRLSNDRRVRTGVPNRHDYSGSDELWDRSQHAIDLRRQRHHRDLAAGKQLG